MKQEIAYYESPVGFIEVKGNADGISHLYFRNEAGKNDFSSQMISDCLLQLDEYFHHKRDSFDLKLNPLGTVFQQQVWNELLNIPYGETISYLDLAIKLGDRNKIRAVGNANGKNPVSIIIPCHRVIGSNGKLVGYGGGLHRKEWLLKFESSSVPGPLFKHPTH